MARQGGSRVLDKDGNLISVDGVAVDKKSSDKKKITDKKVYNQEETPEGDK